MSTTQPLQSPASGRLQQARLWLDQLLLGRPRVGRPRVGRPRVDRPLMDRLRRVWDCELARVRAWGPRRTLLWYWDRRYQPASASAMNVR